MPENLVSESEGARSRKGGAQGFRGPVCELARAIELSAMARKCEELLLKKEKRKSAEELCATLRGQQLATLFRTTQKLAAEKALRKAAEDQVAILQDVLETVTVEKDELQAQLQTQNSGSVLRRGVTWQYNLDGHWEEFAPEANEQMLQAYLDYSMSERPGTQFVTISSGGAERQVDFELMQQKHLRTGKTRCIRALPGAPPNWESSKKKILLGHFHQPFPYDSQLTAAKDNNITHAAAEPKKISQAPKLKNLVTNH